MTASHASPPSRQLAQLELFAAARAIYADGKPRSNAQLYAELQAAGHVTPEQLNERKEVGRAKASVSTIKHRLRWWQQSLKEQKVLERLPGERGVWRMTERNKKDLTRARPNVVCLGFSTKLGAAMWGACTDVFGRMTQSIAVAITSPPYPLAQPRAYGNTSQNEWVDWMCVCLEPIIKRLAPGGSIAINLSNDIFKPGLPARSTYRERFVVAMEDRFGLHKMDDMPWESNKAPGPVQWASLRRMLLNTGYEPVLVFCNDPLNSFASNLRVLEEHTDTHKKLLARGGEKRTAVNSDGANRLYPGSYGAATAGRIPRNVLKFGNVCPDQRRMRRLAKAAGLPVHGASMPLALAKFLVEYLSRPGDLVVDPFGGSQTTAKACEELDRLWMTSELYAEYVMCGRLRFSAESLAAGDAEAEELGLQLA